MKNGSVTSWGMKTNSGMRRCAMFASDPVSKLSTQMTRWPRARSASQRWEPRKPAPPVTRQVAMGLAHNVEVDPPHQSDGNAFGGAPIPEGDGGRGRRHVFDLHRGDL